VQETSSLPLFWLKIKVSESQAALAGIFFLPLEQLIAQYIFFKLLHEKNKAIGKKYFFDMAIIHCLQCFQAISFFLLCMIYLFKQVLIT
jgi:hypothetical protein